MFTKIGEQYYYYDGKSLSEFRLGPHPLSDYNGNPTYNYEQPEEYYSIADIYYMEYYNGTIMYDFSKLKAIALHVPNGMNGDRFSRTVWYMAYSIQINNEGEIENV